MTLVDTVAYENLETGKQYKVAGMLMDKTTGKELLIQDKQVTAETVFEAKEAKGTVDVTFILMEPDLRERNWLYLKNCIL